MEDIDDGMFKRLYSDSVSEDDKISLLHFIDYFLSAVDDNEAEVMEFLQNIGVYIADVVSKEFQSRRLISECMLLLARLISQRGVAWMIFSPEAARTRILGKQNDNVTRDGSQYYLMFTSVQRARVELVTALTTGALDNDLDVIGSCFQLLECLYPVIFREVPDITLPQRIESHCQDSLRDIVSSTFGFVSSYPTLPVEDRKHDVMFLVAVLRFSCFWLSQQGDTVIDVIHQWLDYLVFVWSHIRVFEECQFLFIALEFASDVDCSAVRTKGVDTLVMSALHYDDVISAADHLAYRDALSWMLLLLSKTDTAVPYLMNLASICARLFLTYYVDDVGMAGVCAAVVVLCISKSVCTSKPAPLRIRASLDDFATKFPKFVADNIATLEDLDPEPLIVALSAASSISSSSCQCPRCMLHTRLRASSACMLTIHAENSDVGQALNMYKKSKMCK